MVSERSAAYRMRANHSRLYEVATEAHPHMGTFKVGDKAVYPAHGVGEVVAIESKEISGHSQTFYVLKILDNGMKVMIPTSNVNSIGLREVIRPQQVDEVFAILRKKEKAVDSTTWNRRYREYMEKIKTG